jgi:hypothetical protein
MLNSEKPGQLSKEQIDKLFLELKLPLSLAARGSPVDIPCPYRGLHSPGRDSRPSCRLWFETHPHLHCFHAHCYEQLQELNTHLRLLITGTTDFPLDAPGAKVTADYAYARTIAKKLPKILAKFRPREWPPNPIEMDVPTFLQRLGVFRKVDHIWIGNERDSGQPKFSAHFRTLEEWSKAPPPRIWPFICGAAFIPGSFSRSAANIKALRTFILESDALSGADTYAVARWVEENFTLPLLAMVHSGNKSLHCYFEHPGAEWVGLYRPALVEAGFCAASLRSLVQPMRLANQVRANNQAIQHLLFLKGDQPLRLENRYCGKPPIESAKS